ncbi:MAG TPA: polysaccharide deacetylase family protein, partial [Pyrinomonadaceae bacterium]|nr:polysaccharide deacetylase family protein [Pyrinomonadaceae bacterium]
FTRLKPDEARFELVESRRLLESITGISIDLMAWPYGECSAELGELSKQCGYRAAWSVCKGKNTTHSLWRVPLGRRDNMVRFIAKVSGAYFPTKVLESKLERLWTSAAVPRPSAVRLSLNGADPIVNEAMPQWRDGGTASKSKTGTAGKA